MALRKTQVCMAALLVCSATFLYLGWREFWFLTDDAYIAFRYVSNSVLGHGYVWNPEPFRAVEGYTSFLWVLILDFVWRLVGVEPPKSANVISLLISGGTILITALAVFRMQLRRQLDSIRCVLAGMVMIGLLTNTTFLTWSSSGLETALFNFCFTAWLLILIQGEPNSNRWLVLFTLSGSAVYLVRPDGIAVVLSGVLVLLLVLITDLRAGSVKVDRLLSMLPILITPLHLFWRKSYYGEWLPNTYYAKHVALWPESGLRYLASFMLEYGLWVWIIVLVAASVVFHRKLRSGNKGLLRRLSELWSSKKDISSGPLRTTVAVLTLSVQVGYYTLAVGGDHFEWRVYSHLPPLALLSFVYLLNYLHFTPPRAALALTIMIGFSLPIPWTVHAAEKEVGEMSIEETIYLPTADRLPAILWPLTKSNDVLQSWLSEHLVCIRRQEHKLFLENQLRQYPPRMIDMPEMLGDFPVAYLSNVGVAGWIFPEVAIIDGYGLNDYIIARHEPHSREERKMAHDRYPPENYADSFVPNLRINRGQLVTLRRRPELELTPESIKAVEKYWEDRIIHGIEILDSAAPIHVTWMAEE